MTTVQPVNTDHITRRQKANPLGAGICVGLFGLFASVPIGIRQRDWKVPAFSLGAAFIVALAGYADSNQEIKPAYKLAGHATGGLVAYALVSKNKKESE